MSKNEAFFNALFRLDLFKEIEPSESLGEQLKLEHWVLFVLHRRIERLEQALGLNDPIPLPESVEELSPLVRDFLQIWERERLLNLSPRLELPEQVSELREEFLPFVLMLQLQGLRHPSKMPSSH